MKNSVILSMIILTTLPAAHAAEPAATEMAEASSLAARGLWQELVPLTDRLLADDPANAEALRLRAEAYRRGGRLEAARDDYLALAGLRPEEPDIWFWVGTIERWLGRDEESLEAYTHALTLDLEHHGSLTGRARVMLSQGRPAAAEAELRRALTARPRDPEATGLLAEALAAQSRWKEARGALEATYSGAELSRRLGDLELSGGRAARARRHYRRALEIEPANAENLRRLGEAERRRREDGAALDAYRRAAQLEPGHVGSLYWVGVLATRTGRQGESLAAWEEILGQEPDNVAALVGKARVLFFQGRRQPALALTERALRVAPDNVEARTLRAFIRAANGRLRDAGSDYRAVLAADPGNGDAQIGFERLADARSWEVSGTSDVSRVVEGLDDEGLMVGGILIQPTRIEYLSEGFAARVRSRIGNGSGFAARLARRREAVTQLDSGNPIYDLDVTEATAGLDHRLADGLRFSWHLGGSRFEPRTTGSIAQEERARGGAALDWQGGRLQARVAAERQPFIYRSFAGDTQFRIFDHDRLSLRLGALLGAGFRLEATAGLSEFQGDAESDSPSSASLALRWVRGGQTGALIVHQAPFPERFLTADGSLRFVDYEAVRLELDAELEHGFRIGLEAEGGRFGATARTVEAGGEKVAGPLEENSRATGRFTVAWSPPRFRQLSLGVEGFADRYDFDTAPYNTIDTVAATAFVELAGETHRAAYGLRLESSRVDDDRDPDYDRQAITLRLEAKLGRFDGGRGKTRFGLEGRLATATLTGTAGEFDEEQPRARLYLRVPL